MARRLIYVGPDDDVSELAGKIQSATDGDEVAMVVPSGAQAFQTPLNLRLLRSVGAKRGITTTVVSSDPHTQEMARSTGLAAYSSLAAYEDGVPVELRPAGAPATGGAPPRPPAPVGARVPPPGAGSLPPGGPPAQAPFLPRAPGSGGLGAASPAATAYGRYVPPSPTTEETPAAGGVPVGPPAPAPPEAPPGPWTTLRRAAAASGTGTPENGGAASIGTAKTPLVDFPDSAEPLSPWDRAAPPVPPVAPSGTPGFAPPSRLAPSAAPGRGGAAQPPPPPDGPRAAHRPLAALYFAIAGIGVVGLILFLLLGTSATVTVTVAEVPLTVSPTIQGTADATQATQPNYILSKVVSYSQSQQFQINPTGSQTTAAVAATGNVVLSQVGSSGPCSTVCSFDLTTAYEFETSSNPPVIFSVATSTSVTISNGGTSNPIPIVAATPGAAGNVASGAITDCPSISGDWCKSYDLQAANPSATTGGVDASSQTVASASDIQGWQTELSQVENQLSGDANTKLLAEAGPTDKFAVDPNGDGKSITFAVTPSSFASITPNMVMSAETVTVAMTAQATVYNPADVQAIVVKDLQASANLPSGDHLVANQLTVSTPDVIQAASNGTFALSVTGIDYYQPSFSRTALLNQITGKNPGDVPGIVTQQISDVQHVDVSETPVQLLFMPFFSSRITIVETFVTPAPSTTSAPG